MNCTVAQSFVWYFPSFPCHSVSIGSCAGLYLALLGRTLVLLDAIFAVMSTNNCTWWQLYPSGKRKKTKTKKHPGVLWNIEKEQTQENWNTTLNSNTRIWDKNLQVIGNLTDITWPNVMENLDTVKLSFLALNYSRISIVSCGVPKKINGWLWVVGLGDCCKVKSSQLYRTQPGLRDLSSDGLMPFQPFSSGFNRFSFQAEEEEDAESDESEEVGLITAWAEKKKKKSFQGLHSHSNSHAKNFTKEPHKYGPKNVTGGHAHLVASTHWSKWFSYNMHWNLSKVVLFKSSACDRS